MLKTFPGFISPSCLFSLTLFLSIRPLTLVPKVNLYSPLHRNAVASNLLWGLAFTPQRSELLQGSGAEPLAGPGG